MSNVSQALAAFWGRTARDLMTRDVVSVAADATVADALALMVSKGLSGLPVVDSAGAPLGVISGSDLLVHAHEAAKAPTDGEAEPVRVREVMTPAVFAVGPGASMSQIIREFLGVNVHRLFVAEKGALVGVLTPSDVLRHLPAESGESGNVHNSLGF
jgi:CBS domain-containing protein